MAIVFLGLGSNIGDRELYLDDAINLLNQKSIKIIKRSTIIETEPVGGPPQEKYLNCVIKAETTLEPQNLLAEISKIEEKLGRVRTVKNGPRTIDIDILTYDDIKMATEKLTIPHPEMIKRDFVMIPLNEIAPEIFKKSQT